MVARASLVAALSAAALGAAAAGGAANGRLAVEPVRPVVGARATIDVHARARPPLYVRLVSPTGVRLKVRLTRVVPGVWRAVFHFPDDGQWLLSVPGAGAAARVLVFQPPGALPPFDLNRAGGSKAGALSGLAGPGIVVGR